MAEITEEQRIAVLVYKEDHPQAYHEEIHEATDVHFREIRQIFREYEAGRTRYEVQIKSRFFSYEDAINLMEAIKAGGDEAEVVDVTPCAFKVNHGPGHQSETYCEVTGPHETHGMRIMGIWEEFDKDGNSGW